MFCQRRRGMFCVEKIYLVLMVDPFFTWLHTLFWLSYQRPWAVSAEKKEFDIYIFPLWKLVLTFFSFLGKLSYIRPCLALGSWAVVVVAVLLFLYFVYILDFGKNEQHCAIIGSSILSSCERKSQGIRLHCLKAIIPLFLWTKTRHYFSN